MNKEKELITVVDSIINSESDSIKNYYIIQLIEPIKTENEKLIQQKSKIQEQQDDYVKRGWDISKFDKQIQ
jgi:hypothetical protein